VTEQSPPPIQNPLTMVMKTKSSEDYTALQQLITHFQSLPPEQNPVTLALNKIGTVHFARCNWSGCQRRVYLILLAVMLTMAWCPRIDVRPMRNLRRSLCGRLSRLRS
jgi:hypothetical protein